MTNAMKSKPRYCVISNDGLLAGPIQQFEQNQYWIITAWGTFSTKTKFAAVSPVGRIHPIGKRTHFGLFNGIITGPSWVGVTPKVPAT